MITVNMHDAETRLSELVKAVEERNETVVLCRNGREIAEIRRRAKRQRVRNLDARPPSIGFWSCSPRRTAARY